MDFGLMIKGDEFCHAESNNIGVKEEKLRSEQWRAEGGARGATVPGIQPGGHPTTQFSFLKGVGKCLKMEKIKRQMDMGASQRTSSEFKKKLGKIF